MFFFGSLEGFRRDQSLFTFFTVPDARLRAGDFSQALQLRTASLQQIYDPTTGTANGFSRTQFANNQIPANRIDPIALKVLNLFPLPNNPGTGAGGLHEQLPAPGRPHVRARQLGRQGQLEPHVGASDLGQVQLHERRRSTT